MTTHTNPFPAPDRASAQAPELQGLLQFSVDVLAQGLALVAAHEWPGAPDYATPVGAHLRHVVEHYEALLSPVRPGSVDYDQRPRDRQLERQPAVARARMAALQMRLRHWNAASLDAPVKVSSLAGLHGEFDVAVSSSLGRELLFVASHAIHHYALLKAHCQQHGITMSATFGRASATVAHERSALAAETAPVHFQSTKETSCKA